MKIKILLYVFVTPLLPAGFILIVFKFNPWIMLAVTVGVICRSVFLQRKYLSRIVIIGNEITIQYITKFLQTKYFVAKVDEINNAEYVNRNWLMEECDSFTIKANQEWTSFHVLGKQVKRLVKDELPALRSTSLLNRRE